MFLQHPSCLKELAVANAVPLDHAGLAGKKNPTTGVLYQDLTPASLNLASASHQTKRCKHTAPDRNNRLLNMIAVYNTVDSVCLVIIVQTGTPTGPAMTAYLKGEPESSTIMSAP